MNGGTFPGREDVKLNDSLNDRMSTASYSSMATIETGSVSPGEYRSETTLHAKGSSSDSQGKGGAKSSNTEALLNADYDDAATTTEEKKNGTTARGYVSLAGREDEIDEGDFDTRERRYSTVEEENLHDSGVLPTQKVYYFSIMTTMPLFMGYAGMVVLQRNISNRLELEAGSQEAMVFGIGVSFLYFGNLFFRLLHNVVFAFLKPRFRVVLSYGCIASAMALLIFPYYVYTSKSVVFVFLAYAIAGVGIGTFESNLISTLTPLGHDTKSWAVIGIPIGFNLVSIGSFVLFAIWPGNPIVQGVVYGIIAVMNCVGALVYLLYIPHVEFASTNKTVKQFFLDLFKAWHWFPIIWKHCISLMIDMFAVSLFSSLTLYIYDEDRVPLFGAKEQDDGTFDGFTVSSNAFFAVYYLASFFGDFFSRRIAYSDKERLPFLFLSLTGLGVVLILVKIAVLAPIGMFAIMFANGSIYAHSTKFIDIHVDHTFNLLALSIWLFVGDGGSITGSLLTQPLRSIVGTMSSKKN